MEKRYLKKTPMPKGSKINFDLLLGIIDHLGSEINKHYQPDFSFQQYVAAKPGAVRKRFLRAYSQLTTGTRDIMKISKIAAFVKNERYFDISKSPRMIMGRDPRFNILYARYVARFEDAFFKLPQVCNASNYQQSGQKFGKLYGKSNRMFENDMSKYEATQRLLFLMIEFLVMAKCTPDAEFQDFCTVFAAKIMKAVRTGEGLEVLMELMRGSGDLDTGCGNGVGNYVTTMYFKIINFCGPACKLAACNCGCCDFVVKGDDSYGTVPEKHRSELINTYDWFGLDAKLVLREDGRLVEFCSGHFIRTAGGDYTYVQKLRKLLTSVSTIINPDVIKNGWVAHYLKSLGDMYAILYAGIPIYSDFASFLQTAHDTYRINAELVRGVSYGAWEAFSQRNTQKVDVCSETILDISLVNDMSLAQLMALKETFLKQSISLPKHLQRRCNLRNRAQTTEHLLEDLSQWVNRDTLSKRARHYRKVLVKTFNQPEKMLRMAFYLDKD
jgi:hypothetical protein